MISVVASITTFAVIEVIGKFNIEVGSDWALEWIWGSTWAIMTLGTGSPS